MPMIPHSQPSNKVQSPSEPPRASEAVSASAHHGGGVERQIKLISDTEYKKGPIAGKLPAQPHNSSPGPEVLLPEYAKAKQHLEQFLCSKADGEILNVSLECFSFLQRQAGWEKLLLDYNPQTEILFVRLPLFPHDALSKKMGALARNRSNSDAPPADEAGTTNIHLTDGTTKSANFIWMDPTLSENDPEKSRLDSASSNAYPTVVLEVALSETVTKLSLDCARWMLCTLGKVNLAIGVKIDAGPNNRELKSISICKWTLLDSDWVPSNTYADVCGVLREITNPNKDGQSEHDEGTAYAFSLEMGDKVLTWKTASTLTKIYGEGIPAPNGDSLEICNWHMYRSKTSSAEEDNQIYATLPYEELIQTIRTAFRRQDEDDYVGEVTANLKRKYTELEIADVLEASQQNKAKAARHAESQKSDTKQEAGPSKQQRGRKKGQPSSRKRVVGRRQV